MGGISEPCKPSAANLVGSVEMVLMMVRRARTEPGAPVMATLTQTAPADSEHAARLALAASVAAGNPISQRQMMARFGLTRTVERKVRASVLAGSNGHG